VLVVSGIKALIGLILAYIFFKIHTYSSIEGVPLIFVGSLFLWFFIFVCDIVEDWLIEHFNPDG